MLRRSQAWPTSRLSFSHHGNSRWLILAGICVLALGLALGLEGGNGSAAGRGQTSPLVSPLESPVETPTPTPTSPIPPTLTPPPDLEAWPTPTPTPYPDPVEAALSLVAEEHEVDREGLQVETRLTAVDPTDGRAFTAVQVRIVETNQRLWLRGEADGQAAFLPDFTQAALALVAEQEDAKLDDLVLSSAGYAPYPFLQQVIWVGSVFDRNTGQQHFLAFDLAGEPVDLTELSDAESEAKTETCGAVEARFCPQLFLVPADEPIHARAVLTDSAYITSTVTLLEEADADYQVEELDVYLAAPRDVILDLAHQEGVGLIREHTPDEMAPLDTNLILGLREDPEQMWLTLESQKSYFLANYRIVASLERVEVTTTQAITLVGTIEGIFTPASGMPRSQPALGELPLGEVSGRYDLVLRYISPDETVDLEDRYLFIVSDRRVVLRPSANHFTWPRYVTWLRLPADAIWFVVQARSADAEGQPFAVDPDVFAEKAAAFYADVAELGAEPLTLTEGVYVNQGFIPPWSTWQIPDGDRVRVPVTPEKSLRFRLPDIRYFRYEGELAGVEEVIAAHCQEEVAIAAYTTAGDALEICPAD